MTKHESNTDAVTVDPAVEAERQAALALVESARTAWVGSIGTEAQAVEACAVATFAASPFIGKGNGETGGWETADDYALLFPNRNGKTDSKGKAEPVSKQTVTRWRRMGQAHGLGITPEADSKRWQRLNVSAATDKRVGAALADPKVTLTKVRKAIDSCYADGKYVSEAAAAKAAATAEGEGSTPDPEASVPVVPASVSAMLDALETIAAHLAGSTLTPAEGQRLAAVVESLESAKVGNVDEVESARAS